jgi:hypothetical protein
MPWETGHAFAEAHNKKLHGHAATKAKDMANAMLRAGVPEGEAIATANKHGDKLLRHEAVGGGVKLPHLHVGRDAHIATPHLKSPKAGGVPAAPKAPSMGPVAKPMSPSQGTPWWTRSEARGIGGMCAGGQVRPHRQMGGGMGMAEAAPWFERREASEIDHPGGLLHSSIAGRTDRLPLAVATQSYVIPADVVSGLGSGNTLAGANILNAALKTGPYGTGLEHQIRGHGPPRAPAPPPSVMRELTSGLAHGGQPHPTKHDKVSIVAAGGEFVVPPEVVHRIGGGDFKRGHDILDGMVKRVREHQRKWLSKAPPPKR